MIKPPLLQSGDRVRIVTPASPVRHEMLQQGTVVMRGLGLVAVQGDLLQKWRYLAGSDDHRHSLLQSALNDYDSHAIFFARGGYGCSRLLRMKEFEAPEPKILLGCSDITSLHLYFQKKYGWVVFHGPMPSGDFARRQLHEESFRFAMMQKDPYTLHPLGVQTLVAGTAEGTLLGGCLTLLDSAIGTPWEPDWQGSILFLEDVSIKPYQVDRMLTHLRILGKLDGVRAFIFGEMKDCIQVENQGYTLQEVVLDLLGDLGRPIYFGFPSGHVSGPNWTLPFGVPARVSADPAFRLDILEGAVS